MKTTGTDQKLNRYLGLKMLRLGVVLGDPCPNCGHQRYSTCGCRRSKASAAKEAARAERIKEAYEDNQPRPRV